MEDRLQILIGRVESALDQLAKLPVPATDRSLAPIEEALEDALIEARQTRHPDNPQPAEPSIYDLDWRIAAYGPDWEDRWNKERM